MARVAAEVWLHQELPDVAPAPNSAFNECDIDETNVFIHSL